MCLVKKGRFVRPFSSLFKLFGFLGLVLHVTSIVGQIQELGIGDFGLDFRALYSVYDSGFASVDIWESKTPDTAHVSFQGVDFQQLQAAEIGQHATDVLGVLCAHSDLNCHVRGWLDGAVIQNHPQSGTAMIERISEELSVHQHRLHSISHSFSSSEATLALNQGLFSNPSHLVLMASGNSANRWSQMANMHKNPLVIGNVGAGGISSTSTSLGPTADGRLKPDLVALGSGRWLPLMGGGVACCKRNFVFHAVDTWGVGLPDCRTTKSYPRRRGEGGTHFKCP